MGLGRGKTDHSGPRDATGKGGHWGFTEEAKQWSTRARRRDEAEQLRRELDGALDSASDVDPPSRAADSRPSDSG
jgi:hypothetical protein